MGLQVNVGGVWKTVAAIEVNVGGVWKTVSSIETKIGAAWKAAYSAVSSILYLSTNLYFLLYGYFDPGTASITLYRTGDLVTAGSADSGQDVPSDTNMFVMDADRYTNCGDDFEFRLLKTAGNMDTSDLGFSNSIWYTINTTRTISYAPPSYNDYWIGTIEIREIADTDNEVTANVRFEHFEF